MSNVETVRHVKKFENIDEAKDFLVENVNKHTKNVEYADYIKNTLAGDCAVTIANIIQAQYRKGIIIGLVTNDLKNSSDDEIINTLKEVGIHKKSDLIVFGALQESIQKILDVLPE